MNEQEAYKTVVRNSIVDDDQVKRYARTAAPERKPALRVLKPIGIALAALLIVFGVTMAIPEARAEVFSWFDPANPREYLALNPEDRDSVSEMDAMITEPEKNRTEIKVNYCADEPYWREIGENFSATLGETIYDGNVIYLSIDFDGLSGYPLFESAWCPSLPADALLPTYLAEETAPGQWSEPSPDLYFEAENGVQIPAWIEAIHRPAEETFRQAFYERYGFFRSFDEETASAWREDAWEHCKANGVRAVAEGYTESIILEEDLPIDKNGNLTLDVHYSLWINRSGGSIEKLNVDLGTITVNMTAYKDLDLNERSIEATQDTIELFGDAVWFDWADERYAANLDGVTMRVVTPGTIDFKGIHDVELLVQMPDDWSEEQKEAFLESLLLDVTVDDDFKINYGGGWFPGDGSYLYVIEFEGCIPFNRIGTVQRITLTPILMKGDTRTPYSCDSIVLKVN
jgi:hypothetical protein